MKISDDIENLFCIHLEVVEAGQVTSALECTYVRLAGNMMYDNAHKYACTARPG